MSPIESQNTLGRREFLTRLGATAAGSVLLSTAATALAGKTPSGLIARIEREVVFDGRKNKDQAGWFQPRACIVPTKNGPLAVMNMQKISGSDYYHPVCSITSTDLGKTWSTPEPIPGMGRHSAEHIRPGLAEGTCDVTPEWHRRTNRVIAMGHNVYYEKGRLAKPQAARWPVYSVRDSSGQWSDTIKLEWDDPRGSLIYTCNCSQRVTLDNGDVLVPLSFGSKKRTDRLVTTIRCSFDGKTLTPQATGNSLELHKGRGLLEPSLTYFGGRYWLTIRAESNRGYVSVSDDGLHYSPIKPWTWDDGKPLTMSTTQQHWLTHSDGLFLVYTRQAKNNKKVFRWRSPLFVAQVDPERRCLIRETEQVVLPLVGDGNKRGKQVARMGNFNINHATPTESWVTVGEARPTAHYRGDVLLARITWAKPNRLADVTL